MGEIGFALVVLLCVWSVYGDGEPENLADLGIVLSNTSSVLGGNASFYCEVIGTQNPTEQLIFSKVDSTTGDVNGVSSDSSVLNDTKYEVTERYRLNVKDIVWSDEGEYRCQLGATPFQVAYMVVSDPPVDAEIYWTGGKDWTEKDVKANLTCEAGLSRPPATFRWFRGATEITGISLNPNADVDSNGYGNGISMLELVPSSKEEGVLYSCHADVPGKNNAVVKKINVKFSGAAQTIASACLIVASLVASFKA